MHEVLVNRLGGLSLPRKSVVRLTDRPDMTLDVYCGRKTTTQQQQQQFFLDRLRLPKPLTNTSCTYFHQTTALSESAEGETKECGRPGIEPGTSDS